MTDGKVLKAVILATSIAQKLFVANRYLSVSEEPQAIYKWQRGKSLPTVDNLYALGALLEVPMEEILVPANAKSSIIMLEQQEDPCCSNHFWPGCFGHGRSQRTLQPFLLMQCALGFFRRRLPPLTASDRLPEGIFLTCM